MLSVVIPIYNEELAIRENARRIVGYLTGLNTSWELLLINDGSTDNTLSIISDEARENQNIKVISYEKNRGRGYALKTGFKNATGQYVIATESDLNWGVEIIGSLYERLQIGDADIVVASAHAKGGQMINVPFLRWLLSYLGNIVFSLAIPGDLSMYTGMTRGYKKEVLDSIDLESEGKEMHVELLYKAFDLGFRVVEIPAILTWKKPKPGEIIRKSHFKFSSIIKHLMLSLSVRPFILFGGVGFAMLLSGALFGAYLFWVSSSGTPVGGRPLLIFTALLLLLGTQVLIFGFLANQAREIKRYLIRIQRQILNENNKGK